MVARGAFVLVAMSNRNFLMALFRSWLRGACDSELGFFMRKMENRVDLVCSLLTRLFERSRDVLDNAVVLAKRLGCMALQCR
jgi:hypothetical protein